MGTLYEAILMLLRLRIVLLFGWFGGVLVSVQICFVGR